jgi:ComF family protein
MPFLADSTEMLTEQAQRWASATLNLLFPPRCVGCRRVGAILCDACVDAFEPVSGSVCPVCGEPQPQPQTCIRCAAQPRAFDSTRSAFWFTGSLRQAIHALKYEHRRVLAAPLAASMTRRIERPHADARMCAVPLHPGRLAERGYNQSDLLAAELARCWALPLLPADALVRNRDTASQVGLDYPSRQANVAGAFVASRRWVADQAVLLVDDVCTTGATLHACAHALRAAGAVAVTAITLARALHTGT